jgi:hypothetical protein
MRGYAAFGQSVPEIGYQVGKGDRTRVELRLTIAIDEIDAFIGGPGRRAMLRGSLRFDELGGTCAISSGEVKILPVGTNPRQGRMYYRAGVLIPPDQSLTILGVKELQGGRGRNSIAEAFALRMVLLHGEPEYGPASDEDTWDEAVTRPAPGRCIAAGILHITASGLARTLASFRPKARTRTAGAIAVAELWGTVAGGIADIYLPNRFSRGRPLAEEIRRSHELAAAIQAGAAGAKHPAVAQPRVERVEALGRRSPRRDERATAMGGLRVDLIDLIPQRDGEPLVRLRRVTKEDADQEKEDKGPVVLLAGSSVNADVFRAVGVKHTIVDRLLEEGYDVWLEDWRGSRGRTPGEYSLDEAAVIDHPAVIATVAEVAERPDIKAVVHCLGSSGFMLALAAGRLRRPNFNVTHVVSNAVSLHPLVPPAAVKKIRAFAPVANRILPYMDPQWARDVPLIDKPLPSGDHATDGIPASIPKTTLSRLLIAWVRLTHHECENDVCNFAQFMYGVGPSTLYDESKLTEETARWMEQQFAWAPARLYCQLARSMLAGHLVPMERWDESELPTNLFERGPDVDLDTKITFMVGTRNRTFSPASQLRTYEWFSAHHDNPTSQYEFKALEGFGHLDVWLAQDQAKVHEVVIDGLSR